jgi:CheY-like chemotaxis protein
MKPGVPTPPGTNRDAAGQRRVLVVDDDPLVGAAVQRVLRAYRVTFTQSATGAVGRIQAGALFDAVVCDLMMPGVSGFQLHAELLKIAPELARRVVFLTGYAQTPEVTDFVRSAGVRLVPKPFTPMELRAAVEAATKG